MRQLADAKIIPNLRTCNTITYYIKCQVHSRKFHEGPEGGVDVQLYAFFNLSARWGWVVNSTSRPLYLRERPGTHCGSQGWSGRVRKISPFAGIRSPDRPAPSESLYWLSYPERTYSSMYEHKWKFGGDWAEWVNFTHKEMYSRSSDWR